MCRACLGRLPTPVVLQQVAFDEHAHAGPQDRLCGCPGKKADGTVWGGDALTGTTFKNVNQAIREGFKINKPEGAFYLFPEVTSYFNTTYKSTKIKNAEDLCMYLLEDSGVSMVSGAAFGSPNNIRISYATSEEVMNKAIDRVNLSLKKLNSFA